MKNRKEGYMSSVELGAVCDVLNGFAFRSNNYVNDGIRVIRIANVQKGEIVDNDPQFYPLSTKKQIEKYILEEDDLLVSLTGNVGRVGMLPKSLLPAALNQRVACLRIRTKNIVDKKYLFNILNSDYFEHQCILSAQGIAQKNMSTEWLKTFNVYLPSLERQREIAEVLDKASELVEKRKAQLAELDLLAESVFYDMFGDPVTNTKGWEFDCLKKYLKVIGGYAFKSTAYVEDGIPVLRIGNINSGVLKTVGIVFYEEHDSLSRYIVRPNDMVISLTGTVGKEDYGNICILDDTYSMYYLNQRNAKLDLNSTIDKWYLAFMLKNPQVKNKLTGISRGIRQANISNGDIENIIIPIAPIELQNQFAGIIEKIEKQKAKVKEALKESENLFQRLMQDMFNPEYHNS